jgi:hypothetical protein
MLLVSDSFFEGQLVICSGVDLEFQLTDYSISPNRYKVMELNENRDIM